MKARYLFAIGLVSGLIAIVGLRINANQALQLRNQILQKDQAGADVTAEVADLRRFVFSHMNSSVKFELTGAYNRAVEASRARAQSSVGGELYAQAQAACGPEVGTNSVAQVACVQNYLNTHMPTSTAAPAELPTSAEFSYAFAAPGWSPDLAGLGILAAIITTTAAMGVYISQQFKFRQSG